METIKLYLGDGWENTFHHYEELAKGSLIKLDDWDTLVELPVSDVIFLKTGVNNYKLYQITSYENMKVIDYDRERKGDNPVFKSIMQGLKEAEEYIMPKNHKENTEDEIVSSFNNVDEAIKFLRNNDGHKT